MRFIYTRSITIQYREREGGREGRREGEGRRERQRETEREN